MIYGKIAHIFVNKYIPNSMLIYGVMLYLFTNLVYSYAMIPFALIKSFIGIKSRSYFEKGCSIFLKLLDTNIKIYPESESLIQDGFVLVNHRGVIDMPQDTYNVLDSITNPKTIMVALNTSYYYMLAGGILGSIEGYLVPIYKNEKRQEVFSKIKDKIENKNVRRVIYYPEGQRNFYESLNSVDEAKEYIRPGLLKSIYEYNKLPVQIILSSGKEKVFSERYKTCDFGKSICIYRSMVIHPKDFGTFDEFYTKIAEVWFKNWKVISDYYDEVNK
jgi:hypothetical protein